MNNKMMRGKLQILRDWLANVEDDGMNTPINVAQHAMLLVDMLMKKIPDTEPSGNMGLRADVEGIRNDIEMSEAFTDSQDVAMFARNVVRGLNEILAVKPLPTRILRDGQPVAEFTDTSLARMAVLMFQSNEEANGNTVHEWTVEGDK